MITKIWIRAENKAQERRVALVPVDAARLIEKGFKVSIEESTQRAIPVSEYEAVGCTIAAEGSWVTAEKDNFILGVKELPDDHGALSHRHIYFGHVYKDQPGWQQTLKRFGEGGGTLYDLESLVDDNHRRIAAFGYWAGYAGAATAVMTWVGQHSGKKPPLASLESFPNVNALLDKLRSDLGRFSQLPNMVVIGALGRSGSGAVKLAEELGIKVSKWDLAETASGGPFPAILQHAIFVNCILASNSCPQFVTQSDIESDTRLLTVISDVSCDPESVYNPIPIYSHCSTFSDPVISILSGTPPLDLIAIDHLPSLLPLEASQDYSAQLFPALLALGEPTTGVWGRARDQFDKHMARL